MKKTPLKKWSQQEENDLIECRSSMSLEELSVKFGRSYQAIASKLNRLCFRVTKKRSPEDYKNMVNCETVEDCIKVSKEISVPISYIIRERLNAGKKNIRIYEIWETMRKRCENKNCKAYPRYGGRGITVCNEWAKNFLSFYEWSIKNGYEEHLTIDRIDNNGNYCPENCGWVTYKINGNNKRNVSKFLAFGEEKTLSEWADDIRCKINHRGLYYRFKLSKSDLTNEQKISMTNEEYIKSYHKRKKK